MVPKSFSRASLGCPVRLRNNTMPAALEEGGVLPWRELSMTWARLDAKITASNNDLRGGSRRQPCLQQIVEDIDFCGRGSMFPKKRAA